MMKALLVVAFYFADFAADLAMIVFSLLNDLSDWLGAKLIDLEDES